MKILADRNIAGVEALFGTQGEVALFNGRELKDLAGADILLVRSVTRVDADLLGGGRLKFVGTATSGFDHVDSELLAARGIPFAHAPGSNADSVVDYVLSALAHSADHLEQLLAGAPLGIVGYGHIGRRLHRRLEHLGIRCRVYDPWLSRADHPALAERAEVLACPVVSVHAALTHASPWPSYHMLEVSALEALPGDALLINAGRGELIATGVLLELAGRRPDITLVLDVWEGEPEVPSGLLAAARFGSAHIAGYSYDGKLRATRMLLEAAAVQVDGITAADSGSQLPGPLTVEAPSLEGADLVRWLLAQVYDIREDDRLLREAMPDGFDALRKNYRQRRELGSLRVANAAALTGSARDLCGKLGVEMAPC